MVIQRKAGIVAILISDNIDFKTKIVIRDKEGQHNEQRINPRRRYKNYIYMYLTQEPLKMQSNYYQAERENTIILGDFNTPRSSMDRTSRQKI